MRQPRFKVGDKFRFNIPLMEKQGWVKGEDFDNWTHTVITVKMYDAFGEIIGYDRKKFPPEINADWLIKVEPESVRHHIIRHRRTKKECM